MNAGKQDDVREASTQVTVANNKRLLKGRGNSCPDFFFNLSIWSDCVKGNLVF